MSDAEFNGIMSNLVERRSRMTTGKASLTATHEAVRMIMEVTATTSRPRRRVSWRGGSPPTTLAQATRTWTGAPLAIG